MTAFVVAIAAAVPIVLFPAALVWYLNIGGAVQALQARKREVLEATKE